MAVLADFYVCGSVVVDGEVRSIVRNFSHDFTPKAVEVYGKTKDEIDKEIKYNKDHMFKELVYLAQFNDEIESLCGFEDLVINSVPINSPKVAEAEEILANDDSVKAVIFVDEPDGYLMVQDLLTFEAYLVVDGVITPYVTLVETGTYEAEEITEYIEKYPILTM